MMIVAISGQSINCRLNVVVCTCMEVRETFMCGFLCWWVHCKLWVLMVVWGIKFGCRLWVFQWVGSKISKTTLRITLEEPDENFVNIIEETILLWKNGTKYQFLYANPSRYMSSASDDSCLYFDYVSQIWRCRLVQRNLTCVVVITNLWKMSTPSLDSYIVQWPHPWLQDGGSLARFNSFQKYLRFLSTQIHPLKSTTPVFSCKIKIP